MLLAAMLLLAVLFLAGCEKEPVKPFTIRERIAIYAKEDSWIANGADILMYSDDVSTQKLALYGNNGNIDAEGTLTTQYFSATASAVTFGGSDGNGISVTLYSSTAGDYMRWNATDEELEIVGTNGQTSLDVQDGNVVIADSVYAGTSNISGTSTSFTTGIDGTGLDVTFYSATAGDYTVYDASEERWIAIGTSGSPAIDVQDGYLNMESDEYWDNNTDGSVMLDITGAKEYTYTATIFDLGANKLELDLDDDTSITADTDDQIDVEIGGADEWVFTADQLDVTNGQLVNIGAAGTDFRTDGGLVTARGITITAGGLIVTAGNIDAQSGYLNLQNDEYLTNATDGKIEYDVGGSKVYTMTATEFDLGGKLLDLDLDNDTSWSAATDDQIVGEIGGNPVITFTASAAMVPGMSLTYKMNYATKTAAYTIQDIDSGTLFSNLGVGAAFSMTLPSAAVGLHYGFYTHTAVKWGIDPASGDTIHHLTDSAGDEITNATEGDSIWLVAIDANTWAPLQEIGTWTDSD